MIRVIIESPYAGDIERNTLYARRAMRDSVEHIEAPIASHLLYTQPGILDESNPDEHHLGIECGYAWWTVAEKIIFYIDYGISVGMDRALNRAQRSGTPTEFRRIGQNPNPEQNT